MAIGIILTVLCITFPFIHFWMESKYTEIWKRIAETAIYGILFWALIALFFSVVFMLVNITSQ